MIAQNMIAEVAGGRRKPNGSLASFSGLGAFGWGVIGAAGAGVEPGGGFDATLVRQVQQRLNQLPSNLARLVEDGILGSRTKARIAEYQQRIGLTPWGMPDYETRDALFSSDPTRLVDSTIAAAQATAAIAANAGAGGSYEDNQSSGQPGIWDTIASLFGNTTEVVSGAADEALQAAADAGSIVAKGALVAGVSYAVAQTALIAGGVILAIVLLKRK